MANNLRQHKLIIYRLKRMFGLPATVIRPDVTTHNVETGEITRSFEKYAVRRAILLPQNLDRSFVYDLTFIAANNNFVNGAYFDRDQRQMIIDARDLPKDFRFELDDEVEFDDRRFTIKSITLAENNVAYILHLQTQPNKELSN